MRLVLCFLMIFLITGVCVSQQNFRGSIPEELLRPRRDEAPRYPIDTVIGELGQGDSPAAAYQAAQRICEGLLSGYASHQYLFAMSSGLRENYLSALEIIEPISFRIGGGRTQADGAVSFLVRFIGREYGITGELFVRSAIASPQEHVLEDWVFEQLLLEEAKSREEEQQGTFFSLSYERFF